MIKTFTINSEQKLTPEQLQEVENAKKYPIEFDEDCEELSPAMVKAFKASVVHRNRKKNAYNVNSRCCFAHLLFLYYYNFASIS